MEYSRFNTNINKEWVHYSTLSSSLFSFSNGAHEISVEFCVVKFSSFGWNLLMDYWTRSGKSLSLGMTMAPQYNIRTPKIQILGMPRKASHLSSSSIGKFTWSYIFIHQHDMCFAWSVLYDLSIYLLVYNNHPCCTHLLREPYMIWNLLEYSMCFTYIFWAW